MSKTVSIVCLLVSLGTTLAYSATELFTEDLLLGINSFTRLSFGQTDLSRTTLKYSVGANSLEDAI